MVNILWFVTVFFNKIRHCHYRHHWLILISWTAIVPDKLCCLYILYRRRCGEIFVKSKGKPAKFRRLCVKDREKKMNEDMRMFKILVKLITDYKWWETEIKSGRHPMCPICSHDHDACLEGETPDKDAIKAFANYLYDRLEGAFVC